MLQSLVAANRCCAVCGSFMYCASTPQCFHPLTGQIVNHPECNGCSFSGEMVLHVQRINTGYQYDGVVVTIYTVTKSLQRAVLYLSKYFYMHFVTMRVKHYTSGCLNERIIDEEKPGLRSRSRSRSHQNLTDSDSEVGVNAAWLNAMHCSCLIDDTRH